MVYNLPVLTPPRWVRSRTTPVALENLLVDLVELLNHPSDAHRVFEAAGPEVLSYQQQFIRFMAVSGKHRPLIPIPLPTRWISVWFLNVITSVPPTIAKALIQGLKHDLSAAGADPANADPLRSGGSPHAERRRAVSKLQRLGLRRSGFRPLATGVRLLSEAGRLHRRHSGKPPGPVAGR